MSSWYALRTAPMKEFSVASILENAGFDVVCPVEDVFKRVSAHSKKRKLVTYPLFSRYLFVRYRHHDFMPWLYLSKVRNYSGAVTFDGINPEPVSVGDVERLRRIGRRHHTKVNPHRALRVGDLAEITDGAFRGQLVKVEGLTGNRARIFINLFGAQKTCEIAIEALEAA